MSTVSWFSDRSVIVDLASEDPFSPLALCSFLNKKTDEGWQARVGLTSVIVEFPVVNVRLKSKVEEALQLFLTEGSTVETVPATHHTIPMVFDGEDLPRIVKKLEVPRSYFIVTYTETIWRVAMLGFAPGFGYLTVEESKEQWWESIPRLDNPRKRVPAGSVGVAAGMSAVYPQSMPGGWNLIGHTNVNLFDVTRLDSPALFQAGDTVRFTATEGVVE